MKEEVLSVRLEGRWKDALREMGDKNHRTMSQQITWLIEQEHRREQLKEHVRGAA